jgi:hypothetical protein
MQNLILNILTFKPPVTEKVFTFSLEKKEGLYSIKLDECPTGIEKLLPAEFNSGDNFIYTDFLSHTVSTENISQDINQPVQSGSDNSIKVNVNLAQSPNFAKHYYTWLILNYFKDIADVIECDFINDLIIWFKDKQSDTQFTHYHSFRFRVQIKRVSEFPELVIAYHTHSKVFKKSIAELDHNPDLYNKVIYGKQVKKYKYLSDEARNELHNIFPVLNNTLKYLLKLQEKTDTKKNRYKEFYELISDIKAKYLDSDNFKSVIPLNTKNFIHVNSDKVFETKKGSDLLVFANNTTHISPKFGIKAGAYKFPSGDKHIEIFFICHQDFKTKLVELDAYFKGNKQIFKTDASVGKDDNGNPVYKGISQYIGSKPIYKKENHIIYTDKSNPLPEIIQAIDKNSYDTANKRYVAIYISPIKKDTHDEQAHNIYYLVKEKLLNHGITSQVIFHNTIGSYGFEYSLQNIFVAICAKLDGIPWRLNTPVKDELIIGVGAFKSLKFDTRYIGSAFCFTNDGHFKNFDAFTDNNMIKLAGSIRAAIIQFKKDNNDVKRLIIHFYKTMKREEIQPILDILQSLKLDIPIIVITVNKTESNDYLLFDTNFEGKMPISGTFLQIGRYQYLLCNNTRYNDFSIESYPFPIKIAFWASKEDILDIPTVNQLINQVYQFSRIYWKSVKQQNLPVTIKYPEMVAQIFPYFKSKTLPPFAKNNLWFL